MISSIWARCASESSAAFTTTSTVSSVMLTTTSSNPLLSSRISAAVSFSAMSVMAIILSTASCFCSSPIFTLLIISSRVSLFLALVCSFKSLAPERVLRLADEVKTASPGVSPSESWFSTSGVISWAVFSAITSSMVSSR